MQAGLAYVEARGQLLQIEAQEAAAHVSRTARLGGVAASALLIAWLLAVPAGISLLARVTGTPWEYLALAIAGLHLVLGLILFLVVRTRSRALRPFAESLNQLREDRAWLARKQQQK